MSGASEQGPPGGDRREAVAEFFGRNRESWRDRYAESSFDAYNYRRRAEIARALLAGIPREGGSLLDLGCGAGLQAAAASELGWQVVGADIAVPLLRQARDSAGGPQWVVTAAESTAFASGTFQVVQSLGVIGYVADPAAVLAEIHRLLAPGGYLIISWARRHPLLERASRIASAIPDAAYLTAKRVLTRRRSHPPEQDAGFYLQYNRYWNRPQFIELLAAAGFRVEACLGVNFGAFRFMDRAPWPEAGDVRVTKALERLARAPGFRWLAGQARTGIVLARRTP